MAAGARKLTFPPGRTKARAVPSLSLVPDEASPPQAVRVVGAIVVSDELALVLTDGHDGEHEKSQRARLERRAAFETSRATWLRQPLIDTTFNEDSLYDEQGLPK